MFININIYLLHNIILNPKQVKLNIFVHILYEALTVGLGGRLAFNAIFLRLLRDYLGLDELQVIFSCIEFVGSEVHIFPFWQLSKYALNK